MGATIFPAKYVETTAGTAPYLDSVVERTYVNDPDYGEIWSPTPFELHLTYSSIYTLLTELAFETDTSSYGDQHDIGEFTRAVVDAMLAYDEAADPDGWLWTRLESLMRICGYGFAHGATHICWG